MRNPARLGARRISLPRCHGFDIRNSKIPGGWPPMVRATVHDLARAAGVSLATIDRVLNRRGGVRAATIEKVELAIARLDYRRDAAAAMLAKQHEYRLAFVIPTGV